MIQNSTTTNTSKEVSRADDPVKITPSSQQRVAHTDLPLQSPNNTISKTQISERHLISLNEEQTLNTLFNDLNIFRYFNQFHSHGNLLQLLSTNKTYRATLSKLNYFKVTLSPFLPTLPLSFYITKLRFAHQNNLPIKIQIKTFQDCQNLIDLINDPSTLLHQLQSLELPKITIDNVTKLQELLNLLSQKKDQLTNFNSLSCETIDDNLTLTIPEGLINLHSFSCWSIGENTKLIFSKELINLTSFSCRSIGANVKLIFPKELTKLRTFLCGSIKAGTDLSFLNQLTNLTELSINSIHENVNFTIPNSLVNLIYFSCKAIFSGATLLFTKELTQLRFFSCTTIWCDATLTFAKELILSALSFGNIQNNANISFPENLSNLSSLSFKEVSDSHKRQALQEIQNLIKARKTTVLEKNI